MLSQQLDLLSVDNLLLLDRRYPCRWLPAALAQRGIHFLHTGGTARRERLCLCTAIPALRANRVNCHATRFGSLRRDRLLIPWYPANRASGASRGTERQDTGPFCSKVCVSRPVDLAISTSIASASRKPSSGSSIV